MSRRTSLRKKEFTLGQGSVHVDGRHLWNVYFYLTVHVTVHQGGRFADPEVTTEGIEMYGLEFPRFPEERFAAIAGRRATLRLHDGREIDFEADRWKGVKTVGQMRHAVTGTAA